MRVESDLDVYSSLLWARLWGVQGSWDVTRDISDRRLQSETPETGDVPPLTLAR